MNFEPSHKGSHQYIGKINGKTYVVPHNKLNIYEPEYKQHIPHEVVTSRSHIEKHNRNLSPEEINVVHQHIHQVHGESNMKHLEEKTLTDAEKSKKESLVKSMKKNKEDFKQRYGDKAKGVMYATATKMAKRLAQEAAEDSLVLEELDAKKFFSSYKRNESQNKHTLNASNLAKHFGDEEDKTLAKKGVDALKKQGYQPHSKELDDMHVRLYKKALKHFNIKEETTYSVVKEIINEVMTRKHFQQVADVIKAHPDATKRKELANHHAEIFHKSNPRFDKKKFFAAAGVENE